MIKFATVASFFILIFTVGVKANNSTSIHWQQHVFVVDKPIEDVTRALNNCENYHKLFPQINKPRTLMKARGKSMCYIEADVLSSKLWMQDIIEPKRYQDDSRYKSLQIRQLKGNINHFQMQWELTKINDKQTKVNLRAKIDPGLPVFDSVVEGYVKQALVGAGYRLKNLVLVR